MKYFFNSGTLIVTILQILLIGTGLLVRYYRARRKAKTKNVDPYSNNEYVQAHLRMIAKETLYEHRLSTVREEDREFIKANKPEVRRDLDAYFYNS
jgi:hypothetical protein